MSKCSKCGEEITFGPHPKSGKPSPFSLNGEIHFATCNQKDENKDKTPIKDMRCDKCNTKPRWLYWFTLENGQKRLRLSFECYHAGRFIAETDENKSKVNCTEEEYLNQAIWKGFDKYGSLHRRLKEMTQNKTDKLEIGDNNFISGISKNYDIKINGDSGFHPFKTKQGTANNMYNSDSVIILLESEHDEKLRSLVIENYKGILNIFLGEPTEQENFEYKQYRENRQKGQL